MYKSVLSAVTLVLFTITSSLYAQDCEANEIPCVMEINTDQYGYEFSWQLINLEGDTIYSSEGADYENNTYYEEKFCVNSDSCYIMVLNDSYGDGFIQEGYIRLYVDGEERFSVSNFGSQREFPFNCPQGFNCDNPITLDFGTHVMEAEEEWFVINVDSLGQYKISTCNNSPDCETTIWVYSECPEEVSESLEGAAYYNTSNDECGDLAQIINTFLADSEHLIRVKRYNCDIPINIDFEYLGPIYGCMDPDSCNYNPLAQIDDGSCFGFDDPECDKGADLTLNADRLRTSLFTEKSFFGGPSHECLIKENCLKGVGDRELLRFTTEIVNIGQLDYIIGTPEDFPDQFTYDSCHNHQHYDNYAEYSLYSEDGRYFPIGFKNGFCVIDLDCPEPEMYQYTTCDYMGISAGCTDRYDSFLDCQWLDVTDIPDGDYVFVAKINVDLARDAYGRQEKDTLNNFAQVCLNLDRTLDTLVMTILEDCETYVDCTGEPFGKAVYDCKGICDGPTVRGDFNEDQILDAMDFNMYLNSVLESEQATSCTDLFQDGNIDVYDLLLLQDCLEFTAQHEHQGGTAAHDHCNFPAGVDNFLDTVELVLRYDEELDPEYVYVDIKNPGNSIQGFQFNLYGFQIEGVFQNTLINEQLFEFHINQEDDLIVAVPAVSGALLGRSEFQQGLLKVKVGSNIGSEICLGENLVFVDGEDQKIKTTVQEECLFTNFVSSNIELEKSQSVQLSPNPASEEVTISLNDEGTALRKIEVFNAQGELVLIKNTNQKQNKIKLNDWVEGIYIIVLTTDEDRISKKLIINSSK